MINGKINNTDRWVSYCKSIKENHDIWENKRQAGGILKHLHKGIKLRNFWGKVILTLNAQRDGHMPLGRDRTVVEVDVEIKGRYIHSLLPKGR
jgi:hypothetical protein